MSVRRIFFILLFLVCSMQFAGAATEVEIERLYFEIEKKILERSDGTQDYLNEIYLPGGGNLRGKIFLDVLRDISSGLTGGGGAGQVKFHLPELLKLLVRVDLPVADRITLLIMRFEQGPSFDSLELQDEKEWLLRKIDEGLPDRRSLYLLWSYETLFRSYGFHAVYVRLKEYYPEEKRFFDDARYGVFPKSQDDIRDLLRFHPDLSHYRGGRYRKSVKLFMFCRFQKKYPCMMVMKDTRDRIVRLEDNRTPWHLPSLGAAHFNTPFNKRKGDTPSGVYTIDSVMPRADKTNIYGKFRRIIINFLYESSGERDHLFLLPESSFHDTWWKQAVVARDIGRGLLRIHGSGRKNWNLLSAHYPFVKGSGCITMREGDYSWLNSKFKDQRLLLDELMFHMDLSPVYANETRIMGILYVVPIDDLKKRVRIEDILPLLD